MVLTAKEEFAALMLMDVRVRSVDELDENAIFVPGCRLLIVDGDLSPAERVDVADRFLPLVADLPM